MKTPGTHNLSASIRQKARELGFEICGMAKAGSLEDYQNKITAWLENGYHSGMGYMERNFDKRLDPTLLVENAQSVIVLAHNYFPPKGQHPEAYYKVSKYAFGQDYHLVLKKKLNLLLDYIKENTPATVQARVFTDSAPVLERAWAQKAGIGGTGKNACLIIPGKGSFFFLSEIIINLVLDYDSGFSKDLCGSCTRCMQACPTGAIIAEGVVDAGKCISYLTIESREDIPATFTGQCKEWIFGCDICQDVCPYNRVVKPTNETAFHPLNYVGWTRQQWEALTMETYNTHIKKTGSPLSRASFEKLSNTIAFYTREDPL